MAKKTTKTVRCLICRLDVKVDDGARSAVCSDCMAKVVGNSALPAHAKPGYTKPDKNKVTLNKDGTPRKKRGTGVKYKPSGFPRGWHFKKYYVHTDGKVYSQGNLVKDSAKIKALKKRFANA